MTIPFLLLTLSRAQGGPARSAASLLINALSAVLQKDRNKTPFSCYDLRRCVGVGISQKRMEGMREGCSFISLIKCTVHILAAQYMT